jgi:hypothetical protein
LPGKNDNAISTLKASVAAQKSAYFCRPPVMRTSEPKPH